MEKLLIAVRSEILRDMLTGKLTQYEVYSSCTGTETLALLESLHPHILIMDLSLPGLTGLGVLQKTHYKPPVILALTDLVSGNVVRAAVEAGVQDIILIPCTIRHIITHLEHLIQKSPSLDGL